MEIWTKLDADTLRKMVNATPGGKYLNVATGTIDLRLGCGVKISTVIGIG